MAFCPSGKYLFNFSREDTRRYAKNFFVDMYPGKKYNISMEYEHVEVLKENEELVNIFETGWYKKISSITTPGDFLRIYRENAELSQEELGKKLGKFSRQKISDMERGIRPIGKEVATKLCRMFQVPMERFL